MAKLDHIHSIISNDACDIYHRPNDISLQDLRHTKSRRLSCDPYPFLQRLQSGITLQAQVRDQTDLAAALAMKRTRAELFALFNKPRVPCRA
ncbi:hypothetical protein [Variovorax sp. ZT4R33]|uniref:hypothetical protein n=1 Tax=Variovorax sp. ZT4R33 TaxID=3443743 RepID=UPI003F482C8C